MKYLLIFLLAVVSLNCASVKKKNSSPRAYLNEVLAIVEQHSLMRDSINIQKLKARAYSKLKDKKSIEDCYPIVHAILKDLGDNHSFFMPRAQVKDWQATSIIDDNHKLNAFSGKRLIQNIGYIHMKGFHSGDSLSIQKYADSLQHLIKSIDRENLNGWILDLRENIGGNCWPMLTGIGPLLGNGICGYFIDKDGQKDSWYYHDGVSGINNVPITKLSTEPYELFNNSKPIAILTGYKTGSAGEVIVTAFHDKPNAKSFGTSTAGLSTGNENFKLSDGSMIFLTTAIYADRNGNAFGGKIIPDEFVNISYNSLGQSNDRVIDKAIAWIYEEKIKTEN